MNWCNHWRPWHPWRPLLIVPLRTADAQTVTNGVHFTTSLSSNNWNFQKTNLALISMISLGHKFALVTIVRVRVIIWIKIQWLSHKKMHFEMSSAECRPFCSSLSVSIEKTPHSAGSSFRIYCAYLRLHFGRYGRSRIIAFLKTCSGLDLCDRACYPGGYNWDY